MTALNASYDFENASFPALRRERAKAVEREASLLLLNVTGPRAGDRVEKILSGLSAYHRDIFSDKRPFQKTEVALVVFGGWGQVLKDFVVAPRLRRRRLTCPYIRRSSAVLNCVRKAVAWSFLAGWTLVDRGFL